MNPSVSETSVVKTSEKKKLSALVSLSFSLLPTGKDQAGTCPTGKFELLQAGKRYYQFPRQIVLVCSAFFHSSLHRWDGQSVDSAGLVDATRLSFFSLSPWKCVSHHTGKM